MSAPTEMTPGREAKLAHFRHWMPIVVRSLHNCRKITRGRRTLNESIADLRTAQRPRAVRAARARLHPEIELLIALRLQQRGIQAPTPKDVTAVGSELAVELEKVGGRPRDNVLRHHVEALATLIEDGLGRSIVPSKTKNSLYHPGLRDSAGRVLMHLLHQADPSITETAVGNIVRKMPRRGEPGRRHFHSYFPDIDMSKPPEGSPNVEVHAAGIVWPIYCS